MDFELEEEDESLILPWRWHILFMPLEAGRGISTENTYGLDDVFPPKNLSSGPQNRFICICVLYIIDAF